MLTKSQLGELSNVLAAIGRAQKEGKAITVAKQNDGRLVVKTAAKRNIFKRAWNHFYYPSGRKELSERITSAIETEKQARIDPVLGEQLKTVGLPYLSQSAPSTGKKKIGDSSQSLASEPDSTQIQSRTVVWSQPDITKKRHPWDLSHVDFYPANLPRPAGLGNRNPNNNSPDSNSLDFTPVDFDPNTARNHYDQLDGDDASVISYESFKTADSEVAYSEYTVDEATHLEIPFERVPIPRQAVPKPEKTQIPQGPLSLVPKEAVSDENASPIKEKLEEVYEVLTLKMCKRNARTNSLNITLADARPFLKAYYESILFNVAADDQHTQLYEQLEAHFKQTHQEQTFQQLDRHILWQSIAQVKAVSSGDYENCLNLCKDSSRHMAVMSRMVAHLMALAHRNPPKIQGHPADKISLAQIKFLEDFNDIEIISDNAPPEKLMGRISLRITNEDGSEAPIVMNADFDHFLEQISSDFAGYSQEDEDFHALMADIADIDPDDVATLIEQDKIPNSHVLEQIFRCQQQMLKVETSLGLTWDLTVLTDQGLWPEGDQDGYQAFMKMLELSKLDSQGLRKKKREWFVQMNKALDNPPKVVVEASDYQGYLLALSQFAAGAEVTLLKTDKSARSPDQIIRLDPVTIKMLKFYLTDTFEELFGVDHDHPGKGTLRPDGFGEISVEALESALTEEIRHLQGLNPRGLDVVTGSVEHLVKPDGDNDLYQLQIADLETGSIKQTLPTEMLILTSRTPAYLQSRFIPDNLPLTPEGILQEAESVLTINPLDNPEHIDPLPEKARPFDDRRKGSWGQCTWSGEGINNTSLSTFQEGPLQTTFLDDFFFHRFQHHLDTIFHHNHLPAMGIKKSRFNAVKFESHEMSALRSTTFDQACLKTWCLESQSHIHIEMELPDALNGFMAACEVELLAFDTDKTAIANALKNIQKAWFQAVADQFDLPKTGLAFHHIQPESVKNGVLANAESDENYYFPATEDSRLLMTSVGDSVIRSRHLGFDSITATRQQILACQKFTESILKTPIFTEPEDWQDEWQIARDDLEEAYEHTRQFLQQKML